MSNTHAIDAEFDDNPFRAPEASFGDPDVAASDVAIRKEHISHEASVKSIGSLYLLGGIVLLFASGYLLFAVNAAPGGGGLGPGIDPRLVLLPLLAVIQCITAVGLRRLRGWARIVSGILSGIGLIGFPIGTLINGYILYLLFSAKGSMVFSPEYQKIIAQTPHIKYRTSIIVWVFVGLLLVLLGLGVASMFVR